MPAPQNLSFETVGGSPGLADAWTLTPLSTFEDIAAYGASSEPFETYETGWNNAPHLFAFDDLVDLNRAAYVDVPPAVRNAEDFEAYVTGQFLLTDLAGTENALYGGTAFETFEAGWSNDAYLTAFGVGDVSAATLDTFESGWTNDVHLTAFANIDLSAASYDVGGTPEPVEDFEEVLAERRYVADVTTNLLTTAAAHGFVEGQRLTLEGDGNQAEPLREVTPYFVRTPTSTTLGLALAPMGALIDITAGSEGDVRLVPDRTRYWTLVMVTL